MTDELNLKYYLDRDPLEFIDSIIRQVESSAAIKIMKAARIHCLIDLVQKKSWWQALLILTRLSDADNEHVMYGARRHPAADLNLETIPTRAEALKRCAKYGWGEPMP